VYIKNAHVGTVPGLKEFIAEYVSDRSMGSGGYLEKKGLIPLPPKELAEVRRQVLSFTPLKVN
jgi:phosphate transport system substrate-binding protein